MRAPEAIYESNQPTNYNFEKNKVLKIFSFVETKLFFSKRKFCPSSLVLSLFVRLSVCPSACLFVNPPPPPLPSAIPWPILKDQISLLALFRHITEHKFYQIKDAFLFRYSALFAFFTAQLHILSVRYAQRRFRVYST